MHVMSIDCVLEFKVCVYVRIHKHIHMLIYIRTYIHTYVNIYMHIYMPLRAVILEALPGFSSVGALPVLSYIHVYIHTYIHTYIYLFELFS